MRNEKVRESSRFSALFAIASSFCQRCRNAVPRNYSVISRRRPADTCNGWIYQSRGGIRSEVANPDPPARERRWSGQKGGGVVELAYTAAYQAVAAYAA